MNNNNTNPNQFPSGYENGSSINTCYETSRKSKPRAVIYKPYKLSSAFYFNAFVIFSLIVSLILLSILVSRSGCSYTQDYNHPLQTPKSPVCLFKKRGEYEPKVPWVKRDICQEFQYTNKYEIIVPTMNCTTALYKISHACGIPDPYRIKSHIDTTDETNVVRYILDEDNNHPCIGVCSKETLEPYVISGEVETLLVDGKNCFDDYGYFLDMAVYISVIDDE